MNSYLCIVISQSIVHAVQSPESSFVARASGSEITFFLVFSRIFEEFDSNTIVSTSLPDWLIDVIVHITEAIYITVDYTLYCMYGPILE